VFVLTIDTASSTIMMRKWDVNIGTALAVAKLAISSNCRERFTKSL
jgi:hypothetical protein